MHVLKKISNTIENLKTKPKSISFCLRAKTDEYCLLGAWDGVSSLEVSSELPYPDPLGPFDLISHPPLIQ